jgi:hypothetical protein
MNDPKAVLQEYLVNSNAPATVLEAMREVDERTQRLQKRLETAIKEQREMAETVIRAGLSEYPTLPLAPWLEALTDLVAEREAANWFGQALFEYYDLQITMAHQLMSDDNISSAARKKVEGYLLEDAECDHSVGVCVCELKQALGYDVGDPILFSRNQQAFVKRMRKYLDNK